MPSTVHAWHSMEFMSECKSADSLNLAENRNNTKTTVLFLHGVLRNWRTFYPLLKKLNLNVRLAALDFRGHGASDPSPGAYLVRDYTRDALKALHHLSDRRTLVYGHSLGAMVALATAAEAPELVDGLILEDPPFSTMGDRLRGLPLFRYFAGVQQLLSNANDQESLFRRFSEMIVGEDEQGQPVRVKDQRDEPARRFGSESLGLIDPEVLHPIVEGRWLDGYDLDSLARRIRCPIVAFRADESVGGMWSDSDAHKLQSVWANRCDWIQFEGVGHTIHWARPDAIVESVMRLVNR